MPMDLEFPYSPKPEEEEATRTNGGGMVWYTWRAISYNIVTWVLGALEPREEVDESESRMLGTDPIMPWLPLSRK